MTEPNAVENRRYVVTDSYGARTIQTPPGRREGIVVTYRRGRSRRIYVRGYYNDLGLGDGLDLTLREFCQGLGLTARDVEQALRETP